MLQQNISCILAVVLCTLVGSVTANTINGKITAPALPGSAPPPVEGEPCKAGVPGVNCGADISLPEGYQSPPDPSTIKNSPLLPHGKKPGEAVTDADSVPAGIPIGHHNTPNIDDSSPTTTGKCKKPGVPGGKSDPACGLTVTSENFTIKMKDSSSSSSSEVTCTVPANAANSSPAGSGCKSFVKGKAGIPGASDSHNANTIGAPDAGVAGNSATFSNGGVSIPESISKQSGQAKNHGAHTGAPAFSDSSYASGGITNTPDAGVPGVVNITGAPCINNTNPGTPCNHAPKSTSSSSSETTVTSSTSQDNQQQHKGNSGAAGRSIDGGKQNPTTIPQSPKSSDSNNSGRSSRSTNNPNKEKIKENNNNNNNKATTKKSDGSFFSLPTPLLLLLLLFI